MLPLAEKNCFKAPDVFIVALLIGPALAIAAADFVYKPGGRTTRWILLGIAVALLVFLLIPFVTAELKFGMLIGVPLGLLVAAPVSRTADGRDVKGTNA